MVNVDLSRVIPYKAAAYFVALIPGGFFGISVLFANPAFARQLVTGTQQMLSLNRYELLLVFLFFVFVVGNAFMILVSLIKFALGLVYQYLLIPARYLLRRQVYLPAFRRLAVVQRPGAPSSPDSMRRRLTELFGPYNERLQRQVDLEDSGRPSAAFLWWERLARQLLLKRFGLKEDELPAASFDPLMAALAKPTKADLRGDLLMNAFHATGWAAIVARSLAPALHTRWYAILAAFLILTGLVHDFYVAKRLNDPDVAAFLYLRDIVEEFPKLETERKPSPKADDDSEGEEGSPL